MFFSAQTLKQATTPPEHRLSSYQPVRLAPPSSKIVWWSVAGQVGALFAGVRTVPSRWAYTYWMSEFSHGPTRMVLEAYKGLPRR